jgi:hypothetical protein
MAVGTGGRINTALFQQKLSMATGSKLGELAGRQPELPHLIGVRVT